MRRWGRDLWVWAVGAVAIMPFLLSMLLYYVPLIMWLPFAPLAVIGFFFLYRFRLPGWWPRDLREQDLLDGFRRAGYTASRGRRGVTVRLGKMTAVSFPVDGAGGLKGRYLVDATSYGYGAMLLLFFLWYYLVPFAVLLAVHNVRKARDFVFDGPLPGREDREGGAPDRSDAQVRSMMVDNLSELYRISNEAYESARSDYQDRILIGALLALVAWLALFMFLGWWGQELSTLQVLAASLFLSLLFFAACCLYLWRRSFPGVREVGLWAEKLERAFRAEVNNTVAPDDSSLPTVLEALPHLPEWLELRRRSMGFRRPGTVLVIVMAFVLGFTFATVAYGAWTLGNPILAALLGATSGALLATGAYLYAQQVRTDRAEVQESMREFRDRMEKLDEFLGADLQER